MDINIPPKDSYVAGLVPSAANLKARALGKWLDHQWINLFVDSKSHGRLEWGGDLGGGA